MADRGYKVVYKSRDPAGEIISAADTGGRNVKHHRSPKRGMKKTTYQVAVSSNNDAYVKKNGNAVLVDAPARAPEGDREWKVIRSRKNGQHAGSTESSDDEYDRDTIEIADIHSEAEVLAPTRARDRSLSSGTLEAMRQVRVIEDEEEDDDDDDGDEEEDDDDDDDYSKTHSHRGRSRKTLVGQPADRRAPSALRRQHSPASIRARRSRSVGFYKRDVENHDASDRTHQRPGAEAHLAGRYLVSQRGEYRGRHDDYDDDVTDVTPPRNIRPREGYDDDLDRPREREYYPRRRSGEQSYRVARGERGYERPRAAIPGQRYARRPGDDESFIWSSIGH